MYHYTLKIIGFFILSLGVISPVCNNINRAPRGADQAKQATDLSDILLTKKLTALVDNSTTSYFIYKGEPMGYEYELLQSFARSLHVDLQVVVAKDMNEILDLLIKGEVDIVAANLTVTEERIKKVNFTDPLLYTRQVLVQCKPKGWEKMSPEKVNKQLIKTTVDLAGKNIYVRKGSSFYSRLSNLQEEIASPINITEMPGEMTTEELITMVANRKISYTVADENVAMVNQIYYPQIDIKTAISFPQKIAWAVNKSSPELLAALNNWILNQKNTVEYAVRYNRYFKNPKGTGLRADSEFSSLGGNKISPYDDLIMAYSKELGWDWRLLASMIYQESKFNPNAESWAGACGLMQIIPSTAIQYGLDTCGHTAIQSIDAGTRYLMKIEQYWLKHISDKDERIKFTLASYNVGLGHIIDARNLARKYGKNPNLWYDHIEKFILLKSKPEYYNDPISRCGYCRGEEPYKYVREIMARYEHYKNTIKTPDPIALAAGI